jgi:hypothetical protein
MAKLKGLGRGLDALLSTADAVDDRLTTLPLDSIRPGKYQPRSFMDEAALDELAASIRAQGVIQPLVVREIGFGDYELIAGERISLRSALLPVTGLSFRENPLGRSEEFHCPRQKQFVITLFGAVEISCGGGKRCFGPGDVLFAEDLTGEGHANRELLGPRESLIIPVPEDFDIRRWAKRA